MSLSLIITLISFDWWAHIHPIIATIRQVLILTYTLVHEFAHAAVGSLADGEVLEMKLNYNASGHVVSATSDEGHSFVVTFAGYTLPCIISLIMYFNLMLVGFHLCSCSSF